MKLCTDCKHCVRGNYDLHSCESPRLKPGPVTSEPEFGLCTSQREDFSLSGSSSEPAGRSAGSLSQRIQNDQTL